MRIFLAVLAALVVVALLVTALLWPRAPTGTEEVGERAKGRDATPGPHLAGRPGEKPPDGPTPEPSPPAAPVWRLSGRVLDAEDRPVAGAKVVAWLDPGFKRVKLGETTSDEEGGYTLVLEALLDTTPALRVTSALVAEAAKEGFQPGTSAEIRPLPLDPALGQDLTLDLRLSPGGRVVGRVVGAGDRPLADVSVTLLSSEGEALGNAETDAAGGFEIGVTGDPMVEVWATSRAHGIARSGALRLGAKTTTDVGTLTLAPGATIEGRLIYADGSPVTGIWIYGDLVDSGDTPATAVPEDVVGTQTGAESDAEGRFAMQTFLEGTYQLQLLHSFGAKIEASARSGDHEVEIVVPLHRLVVRLLDETGAPLPGCMMRVVGWMPESRAEFEEAVSEDGGADSAGNLWGHYSLVSGRSTETDGRNQLLVAPGSAWIFFFEAEGLQPVERAIRIPEEGNETHVDVVVPSNVPTGSLDLTVRDAYGERIEIFDFELTTRLGSVKGKGKSSDLASFLSLPAGPAKLRVHPGPARHSLDRRCQILSPYFSISTHVEIPAGSGAIVTLDARTGGWVRLTPTLDGEPGEDALGGMRLDVRAEGSEGPWTYVPMFVYGEGEDFHGTSELKPNVPTRVGQLLEAGRQELRFLGRGFKPLTVPVTVVPGREVDVVVHLERS